jgi:hypothetical protein
MRSTSLSTVALVQGAFSTSASISSTMLIDCWTGDRPLSLPCQVGEPISRRDSGTTSFQLAQDVLRIPRGTTKATMLIETVLAAFEMDEILYELRSTAQA